MDTKLQSSQRFHLRCCEMIYSVKRGDDLENKFKIKQSVLVDCFVNTADLCIPDIVTTIGIGLFSKSYIFDRFIQSVLSSENNQFSENQLRDIIRREFNSELPLRSNFAKVTLNQLMSRFHISEIDCLGVLSDLSRVKTIYVPKGVTLIEEYAFTDLKNLYTIFYEGSLEDWNAGVEVKSDLSKYNLIFSQRPALTKRTEEKDEIYSNTLYVRGVNSQVQKHSYFAYDKVSEVVILPSVTSIQEKAFFSSHVKHLAMSNTVTELGELCFSHSDLETIALSNMITVLPHKVFSECVNLKRLCLPKGLKTIGDSALSRCTALECVHIPISLQEIARKAFYGCSEIVYMFVPEAVTQLGEKAFAYCTNLRYLIIFGDISTLPVSMCEACTNLEFVILTDAVKVIETAAFNNCNSNCRVIYNGTPEQWNKVRIGAENDILSKGVEFYVKTNSRTRL